MNKSKFGSYGKILTFTVVATALICIFGFSADGWQSINNKEPDSGNTEDNKDPADDLGTAAGSGCGRHDHERWNCCEQGDLL